MPEWETPAVDQTAMIPWGLERYYRGTGDLDFVSSVWPMVEQAAQVCLGDSGGHPGLYLDETLNLISSAGMGDQIFGAFLYSNACVVAGLRAAARLAVLVGREETSKRWQALADRIWNEGILREPAAGRMRLARPDRPRVGPIPQRPADLHAPRPLDEPPRLPDRSLGQARRQHAGPGRPLRPASRRERPAA